MRKLTLFMILSYVLIIIFTPKSESPAALLEGPDEGEKVILSDLEVSDGYVNLTGLGPTSGKGKIVGSFNDIVWKAYQDIDEYLYVNGKLNVVDVFWSEGNLMMKLEDFENHFGATQLEDNQFEVKEVPNKNSCKTYLTKSEIVKMLEDPNPPIENATITEVEGQLPGSSRDYRNGFHEGFDWYSGAIGIEINKETPVTPIYAGEVVRIDHHYQEPPMEVREELLLEASQMEKTPQDTLDILRGRQVWIQSENNVLVRYAHLDAVNPELKIGDQVSVDEWIGNTGNSGTSNGVLGTDDDIHLHTDILICGENFWEYGERDVMVESLIELYKEAFDVNTDEVNDGNEVVEESETDSNTESSVEETSGEY